jgi:hypothetical protein
MQLGRGFRRLAAIVDELERDDVDVVEATVSNDEQAPDGTMQVDLRLSVPVSDAAETGIAEDAENSTADSPARSEASAQQQTDRVTGVTEPESDGTLEPSTAETDASGSGQQEDEDPSKSVPDEGFVCPFPDCDATFDSEPGMKIHRTKVHLSSGEASETTDSETPAYRDPAVLADVYADHDTFPAMREALDADVSTQTVRRHMIKHGIHDPDATGDGAAEDDPDDADGSASPDEPSAESEAESDTGATDEGSTENQHLTDGSSLGDALPTEVDCPDGVSLERLRATVETADTLYDVQQEFDLDRETARELLAALDLLELVHGRVATRSEREELKTEIDRRIRESIDASA